MIEFGSSNIALSSAPFLIRSEEGDDNCVRFFVSLSCEFDVGTEMKECDIESLERILENARLMCPDVKEVYEVVFEGYILYQVRNESFCSKDDYEIRKGDYFIVFEKSRLLDMLPLITDCQICADGEAYPGVWKHYGIYCQNHIVDIVSCNEPVVRKVELS